MTGVLRAAGGGSDRQARQFLDVWQDEVRRAPAGITEE